MLKPELLILRHVVLFSITSFLFTKVSSSSVKMDMMMKTVTLEKNVSKSDMIKEKEIEGWERGVDRDPKKYFDQFKGTTIISGKELCNPNINIVVVIPSLPGNINERAAIRETWARAWFRGVKVGFLVGFTGSTYVESMIDQESTLHKDIIQEQLTDTYNNLTLKSILLFKWFLRHCPTQKFLVKADDDTYIDVPILARDLAILPRSGVLQGFYPTEKFANRYVTSKRYCPKYMYPNRTYPVHLSGAGYFMSRDVVAKLYNTALNTPIVHLENIYITGICAEKAGVEPKVYAGSRHVRRMPGDRDCSVLNRMCHSINPAQMYYLWDRLRYEKALSRRNP